MDFFSFRENLSEAAVSKQQQKLFALALAYRKGEVPEDEVSDTVKKLAKDVSMKELEKFASTSHKGLPDKIDEDKRKGLPPHLRKHFDKNGDPVKKSPKFKKAKDVTPKGYGPDESIDEGFRPKQQVQSKKTSIIGRVQSVDSKTGMVKVKLNGGQVRDFLPQDLRPMVEKMDPTKHVNKDGDEYVVVDKNGEEVKRFKDKDTADKYATDNHDALMES